VTRRAKIAIPLVAFACAGCWGWFAARQRAKQDLFFPLHGWIERDRTEFFESAAGKVVARGLHLNGVTVEQALGALKPRMAPAGYKATSTGFKRADGRAFGEISVIWERRSNGSDAVTLLQVRDASKGDEVFARITTFRKDPWLTSTELKSARSFIGLAE
jgi:hypothetical protein